ncbi:uncharacterized protein LOC129809613 [Phlebotomus papatasi]|uniref:uncharacterized protein LOC129809613 n=1 Tax=Phlebotomus papatasi TaxID=29031 RepID=UPI002483824F|nr:uncharacterized protein LOC129809613 [Phlebotomus papatasi]
MNENFSDAACHVTVSHEDTTNCNSGGESAQVCSFVKQEEKKSENVSGEHFTHNFGDAASDGNFSEVNYWAYNNNFLFPPHIYKRLFEQAIFHKRNYLPAKIEKSSQWEGAPGDFTPANNCISREKCESESLPRRIEDQKGFFSLMNTVMNDQMPTQESGIHHMWSRGDLGKLRAEHGNSNELTRKDDDQGDHHMTTAMYPGTAMRSASVPIRSMSPQHGHAGPPAANGSHLLSPPQPLDATKIGSNLQNGPAIGGRKYHCKICSQVSELSHFHQIHLPCVS